MATSGSADISFWMEPHNGNSSDKKTFTETIKRVRDFQSALKQGDEFTWVADSALYNKDKLISSVQMCTIGLVGYRRPCLR